MVMCFHMVSLHIFSALWTTLSCSQGFLFVVRDAVLVGLLWCVRDGVIGLREKVKIV
jgi:hypothetical protein